MIQYKREGLSMATKLEQKYKAEWKKMSMREREGYYNNFINFLNKRRVGDGRQIQQKQD